MDLPKAAEIFSCFFYIRPHVNLYCMESNKPNYPAMLQIIYMVHVMLILAPLVLGGIAVYLTESSSKATNEVSFLSYLPILLLIICFPLASILFKSNIKGRLKGNKTLQQKIAAFQTAHLIRMAMFEACGLLAGIVTLQTGNYYNLAALAVVLVMFIVLRPTPTRIAVDLELNLKEKQLLQKN